ncbi:MAG: triose-phosphate isomerase [Clostridia bacterium]
MRKSLIAGNWKMYKTTEEITSYFSEFLPLVTNATVDIAICTPTIYLSKAIKLTDDSNVKIGAENCFHEIEGAFTGEVSIGMLVDIGCTYTIIGHSERRLSFCETDKSVNNKMKAALAGGIIPILCCGESLLQRESQITNAWIEIQIKMGLLDITVEEMQNVVIAYEPIWAIGTGKVATVEQAQEVICFIRQIIKSLYGETTAEAIRILYGGSVNANNIKSLMSTEDIDGALVGGASLKPIDFAKIVNF